MRKLEGKVQVGVHSRIVRLFLLFPSSAPTVFFFIYLRRNLIVSSKHKHSLALPTTPYAAAHAHQQDGHEVAGFASTMPGNDSNASLKATAASINIAAAAVESTGGAQSGGIKKLFPPQKGAANAFTSSGGLSTSPQQPPPPPPAYDLALTMPLSPRRYRQSAATKPVPSTDRADTAHVSPSQSPHYTPWASSSPGARTKTTTATSPLRKGTTAPTAVGAGAAAGAAESVLLGPPPPPPYEVIFSPKASAAEHAEAPRGDSGASSVTAAGLDQGEASSDRVIGSSDSKTKTQL